jgi:hypothetical protein
MNNYFDVLYDGKHYTFDEIYSWLKKNCRGKYYAGVAWNSQPLMDLVQFESEQDAVLFSLKFLK